MRTLGGWIFAVVALVGLQGCDEEGQLQRWAREYREPYEPPSADRANAPTSHDVSTLSAELVALRQALDAEEDPVRRRVIEEMIAEKEGQMRNAMVTRPPPVPRCDWEKDRFCGWL